MGLHDKADRANAKSIAISMENLQELCTDKSTMVKVGKTYFQIEVHD